MIRGLAYGNKKGAAQQKIQKKRSSSFLLCATVVMTILLLAMAAALYSRQNLVLPTVWFHTMKVGNGQDQHVESSWSTSERDNLLNCLDSRQSAIEDDDHRNESITILMVGDSRMRQQFHSLLSLLPDYDRYWSGPLFSRRIYHVYEHVDTCVSSNILRLEICYWWRPHFEGIGLSSEIQRWSDQRKSSRRSFLFLGIGTHYITAVQNKTHVDFTEELFKLVDPLHRIIENRNGTLSVVWIQNQIMFLTMRGKFTLYSNYGRNKIRNFNEIVQKAFQKYPEVQVVDINPESADEYVRACQATGRADFLQFFHCENPVHLGFVLIEENTRFLIREVFCAASK